MLNQLIIFVGLLVNQNTIVSFQNRLAAMQTPPEELWGLVWWIVIVLLLALPIAWLLDPNARSLTAPASPHPEQDSVESQSQVASPVTPAAPPAEKAPAEAVTAEPEPIPEPAVETPVSEATEAAEVEAEIASEEMPVKPDNLRRIEGIGPKISGLLNEAGIYTFAQLAGTDVEKLREILLAVNLRIADPTTWPEQAQLAAAGDWKSLEKLQDELKGGRRVES